MMSINIKLKKIFISLFIDGRYFEDILWTPNILRVTKTLVTVPNINYFYRVARGSIVKKNTPQKQHDLYCAKKSLIEFFKENQLELSKKNQILTKEIRYFLGIP